MIWPSVVLARLAGGTRASLLIPVTPASDPPGPMTGNAVCAEFRAIRSMKSETLIQVPPMSGSGVITSSARSPARAAAAVPAVAPPQDRAQDPPAVKRGTGEQVEGREQDVHRGQPAERGDGDGRAAPGADRRGQPIRMTMTRTLQCMPIRMPVTRPSGTVCLIDPAAFHRTCGQAACPGP